MIDDKDVVQPLGIAERFGSFKIIFIKIVYDSVDIRLVEGACK
jgi:hypothetical protein